MALIRVGRLVGSSAPFIVRIGINRFSHDVAKIIIEAVITIDVTPPVSQNIH